MLQRKLSSSVESFYKNICSECWIFFWFEAYARILIIRCYMKHGIRVAVGIFQLLKHPTLAL